MTFIEGSQSFYAKNQKSGAYCDEEEIADVCSGPFGCVSGLVPDSELMTWDSESGAKICEHCHDEYEYRVQSD